MNWNKRFLSNLNLYIPITVILLIILGFIVIGSAVEFNNNRNVAISFLQTQFASVVLGMIIIFIIQFYDYSLLREYSSIMYIFVILMLTALLVIGNTIAGGKRWLELGPVNFQPAEITKLVVIIVLARILVEKKDKLSYLTGFIKPTIAVLLPFVLIILQNDLGTALVLLFIFVVMLYAAGANAKYMSIIFGGSFLFIVGSIAGHLYLKTPLPFIKEYQLNRLLVFVRPDLDPQGIGYNILQSKIALGSGRLWGKGLFAGTQNQLDFLPEKHTDFIFSVLGEEFGFIGVLIVLSLFIIFFWQTLKVAREARDDFGKLVVVGIAAMFFFHVLENIGMTMGVMPITGIPLPLISYGGSSMVTFLIAIGIIININIRQKKITF